MKPNNVMIDIETMDLIPNAAIVSIGAIVFDPRYGIVTDDTFYVELAWKTQERSINKETRQWWKGQSPKAKSSLHGTATLVDALEDLAFWIPEGALVWGNGPSFDMTILEDAYRQVGIQAPWKFWNVYDCRTIKYMYESLRGGFDKKVGGGAHNALLDAKHQAQYVNKMWKSILTQTGKQS